ncbi:ABC transporter substrate-binding protein [Falsiporphyromonas endometrii]|uniref:ABC transporter substrate-binding protein n=1 Tax=Falsiporphyromonas endometrii TaxID=1387297 RepID=A0ABV9K7V4_9PORP
MKANSKFLLLICITLFCVGCKNNYSNHTSKGEVADSSFISNFSQPLNVKFAQGFGVDNYKDYKRVSILDIQTKDTIATYFFLPKGITTPDAIKDTTKIIRVPIERVAIMSTTYLGAFDLFDATSLIVAATDCSLINNSKAIERVKNGSITDLGSSMEPNAELITAANPDILLLSDMTKDSEKIFFGNTKVRQVIENDWKETTLLGRAEWLKMVALLTGEITKGNEIFDRICNRYNEVKQRVGNKANMPSILFGTDYKGQWYLPGKDSYVTHMIEDASGSFDTPVQGNISQPMAFEAILNRYKSADKWLSLGVLGVKTLEDLQQNNPRYALFDAFKNGEVYMADKKLNANGGNDFFESGVYAPDVVLKDLVSILYPDIFPNYKTVYWRRLPK